MKRFIVFLVMGMFAVLLPSAAIAQDDVYHSPSYNPYSSGSSTTEQYSDGNGNTYITNNYYDEGDGNNNYDDDYDYFYQSRLRRFQNPYMGMSYFGGCYVDRFWYGSPAPYWGQTIYYDPFWGGGWNNPWAMNIGWGNRWNRWNNWGWGGGYGNPWAYNAGWNNWGGGYGWNNWGWGAPNITYIYYNDGPYYSGNNNNNGNDNGNDNGYSGSNSNYYGPRPTHDNYGGRVAGNGTGITRNGKASSTTNGSTNNGDTGIQYTPSSVTRPTYTPSGSINQPTTSPNTAQPSGRDNVRPDNNNGMTQPTDNGTINRNNNNIDIERPDDNIRIERDMHIEQPQRDERPNSNINLPTNDEQREKSDRPRNDWSDKKEKSNEQPRIERPNKVKSDDRPRRNNNDVSPKTNDSSKSKNSGGINRSDSPSKSNKSSSGGKRPK